MHLRGDFRSAAVVAQGEKDHERDNDRARAYERAARTIEALHDLDRRVADATLVGLPGIGTSIARVVTELSRSGRLDTLDRLTDIDHKQGATLLVGFDIGYDKIHRITSVLRVVNEER